MSRQRRQGRSVSTDLEPSHLSLGDSACEKASKASPQLPAAPRPPTEAQCAELAAYAERAKERPHPPRFALHKRAANEGDPDALSPVTGLEPELFRARLANTFGTVDELAVALLLSQAAGAVEGKETASLCNSASALIAGIGPRNEIEGMLAVQMLAAHNMSLTLARRALKTDRVDFMERYGRLSAKLMNVFTRQLEALARLRGQTGKQLVRVEHVTVESGGQAVVGAVAAGNGSTRSKG